MSGFWFRLSGSGFRVPFAVFEMRSSGFRIQGSGFQGSGFRVWSSLLRVQALGSVFKGKDSDFKIYPRGNLLRVQGSRVLRSRFRV